MKTRRADRRLRSDNFQGHRARERSHQTENAALDVMGSAEGRWFRSSRYRRRGRVTSVTPLTTTGTVRVGFEVVDGEPFHFDPGQFVGIEGHFANLGYRRSPYCILTSPTAEPVFDLLVRAVPEGPLSGHLTSLQVGDEVAFRGPTGRSMVPRDDDRGLELFATGTGIAPFYSLAGHLLRRGYPQPIVLWWGLRLIDDICLTDGLDALADDHPNFSYHITLSQPPSDWEGLRRHLGESVPPLLAALEGKRFYLAGNGAMVEETARALSALGVIDKYIYKEPFFDGSHQPDPDIVARIRDRFVAADLRDASGPRRQRVLGSELDAARSGRAANGAPMPVSALFDLMPAFLSHHPDSDEHEPVESEGAGGPL